MSFHTYVNSLSKGVYLLSTCMLTIHIVMTLFTREYDREYLLIDV